MFFPGQRVRCINDDFSWAYKEHGAAVPTLGAVYTIRDVQEYSFVVGTWFYLDEIRNPVVTFIQGAYEPPFLSTYFRPLSDISVFTALLKTEKQPENA